MGAVNMTSYTPVHPGLFAYFRFASAKRFFDHGGLFLRSARHVLVPTSSQQHATTGYI
jgi:hypothetical protein